MKRKGIKATNLDAIKAMRRGGREAEMELLGPGFHATTRIHQSKRRIQGNQSIKRIGKYPCYLPKKFQKSDSF